LYRGHVAWLTVFLPFYSDLLDKAIRSMADLKVQRDINSLFTSSKITALVNSIRGTRGL
jgi:hypothetical protein